MKKKIISLIAVSLLLFSMTFSIDGCGPWQMVFHKYGCVLRTCNGSDWTTIAKQKWTQTCTVNGVAETVSKWTEHYVHCGC